MDSEVRPEAHLDTYAAEVVRAIFRWKLAGFSQNRIAKKLNDKGVLCPMEYKLSLGVKVQTNFRVHKQAKWSPVTVTRILTNEIYTGVLLQGKSSTPNYKVKKRFRKDRTAGMIVCGDCGQNMVRKIVPSKNKRYVYYVCSTHKAKLCCSSHSISEKILEDVVLQAIQNQIAEVINMEELLKIAETIPENQRNVFNYDAQIVKLKEEIERDKEFKLKLYENLQQGMLDQEEYSIFKKNYEKKIRAAKKTIKNLEEERESVKKANAEEYTWIDHFKKYEGITTLERQAVVNLISEVRIYEGKRVEVDFLYADEMKRALRIIHTVEGKNIRKVAK